MNANNNEGFTSLSRSYQLKRLRVAVNEGLARFNLPSGRLRLVQYELNAIYRLAFAEGDYFVRLSIRPDRSVEEISSEMAWLESLADQSGVRAPEPVPAADGALAVRFTPEGLGFDVVMAVSRWIDGAPVELDFASPLAGTFGEAMGAMHANAEKFQPSSGFTRPSWTFERMLAGLAASTPEVERTLGTYAGAVLTALHDRLADATPDQGPASWGLVHADLHRGNALLTDAGEPAFIDFEDCGWGYYALDIATFLSSVARLDKDDHIGYRDFAARFLDGYAARRDLPPETADLNRFLALRDVFIVNYLAASTNPTVAEWRTGRLTELVAQLSDFLDTGDYLGSIA